MRQNDDLDGPLTAYNSALQLAPESAPLRSNYGYLLIMKGDLDAAIQAWQDAVKIDPDYSPPYGNLGEALTRKGDLKGAITAYEQFLQVAPEAPNADIVRGRLAALKATAAE